MKRTQTIMYGVISFLAASVLALYVYFFQQLEEKPDGAVETLFLQQNAGSVPGNEANGQAGLSAGTAVHNGKSIWERIEDAVLEHVQSK